MTVISGTYRCVLRACAFTLDPGAAHAAARKRSDRDGRRATECFECTSLIIKWPAIHLINFNNGLPMVRWPEKWPHRRLKQIHHRHYHQHPRRRRRCVCAPEDDEVPANISIHKYAFASSGPLVRAAACLFVFAPPRIKTAPPQSYWVGRDEKSAHRAGTDVRQREAAASRRGATSICFVSKRKGFIIWPGWVG